MDLAFATSELEDAAQSERLLRTIFGASTARACQRLYELAALDTLQLAAQLPTLDLRQHTSGDWFSVSVCPKHRITFAPIRNSEGTDAVDSVDFASVTAIRILALGGRHDD